MSATIASLWIGNTLSAIELASLYSFNRLGHRFVLYAYSEIINVPDFVELRDAREVFPARKILRHHKNGSPALHSDLFRYSLMAQTDYIWADLDVIALREFKFDSEHVFGLESSDIVGSAVLRLPRGSVALRTLLSLRENTKGVPPYLTGIRKLKYKFRNKICGGLTIEKWPWGSVGPRLLTNSLLASGEVSFALPVTAFYSVPLEDAWRFCEPDGYSREMAPSGAYAVHLWANKLRPYIKEKYNGVFPRGSFVMREASEIV